MVVVACHDRTVLVQEHHAVDIETLGTALVGKGCGHLLVSFQFHLLGVGVVGLVRTAYLLYAHGHLGDGLLCPCRCSHVVGNGGRNQIPLILVVACATNSVICGRSLKTCKDLVAHDHLTASVTDGSRLATGLLGIHIVGHGDDVEHIHIAYALQFHLGAQVVASVAQNCTPKNLYLLAFIGITEDRLQSLAGIVLGTTDGIGVGREILLLEALQSHLACCNLLSGTEAHDEEFSTCNQIHGLAAKEVDILIALEETCGQHIVI